VRDRLTELLPLLLVGLVLLAFQLTRTSGIELPELPFLAVGGEATPTPTPIAVSAQAPRQPATVPVPKPAVCTLAQPRFAGGIAALKASLGTAMGDPLECERVVDGSGDTQQKTTTGLAYYRKAINVAAFTTGWDHWGLVDRGVVHWVGASIDPPSDAALLP
jgi:hypothetical protein